ncbi:MAG: hypothetical protein J6G98_00085 [Bacilli bacterium]|nr:hypothetical protein [Bacilli bacterium]
MNNKGFAISGILYSILVLFLVLISLFLFSIQNKKRILDTLKNDALKSIEGVLSENDQLTFTLMKDNEIIYKDSITRDYFNYNIEQNDITNISCNNKAIPSYSNSVLTVNNITKNTTCILSSSINYTFDNLGASETNILMINDEKITKTLDIESDKKVKFNLNGKNVEIYNPNDLNEETKTWNGNYTLFIVAGQLTINDDGNHGNLISYIGSPVINVIDAGKVVINGGIYNGRNTVQHYGDIEGNYFIINDGIFTSKLYSIIYLNTDEAFAKINGGHFEVDNSTATAVSNDKGTIVINDGYFKAKVRSVLNMNGTMTINDGYYLSTNNYTIGETGSGTMTINGGVFISDVHSAINNVSTGTINISQTNKPIYVSSKAINTSNSNPAIRNTSTGTINIKSNTANNCTNNASDTTSGLCVYAEGDKNYSDVSANLALQNAASGNVNINGGTFYGGHQAINNNSSGVIKITNAQILSGNRGINNYNNGTVNICNSTINATTVDLRNTLEGVINYNANMIFTNGTNTPTVYNPNGTINANYSGTCEA